MIRFIITVVIAVSASLAVAQTGVIKGKVTDELNNETIPFANILLLESGQGAAADVDGNFIIRDLEPGSYNVQISFLGYDERTFFDVQVLPNKPAVLDATLKASETQIKETVVKVKSFRRRVESPLSIKSIGVSQIERFPGGNRDISRVLQSLPGVVSSVSFRNDIIVRGGAPSENRFYIDDIEIPSINHFATQGASGGSNGFINVDFIQNVDFITGAYPANRGNTLSSVLNFKFKDGGEDRVSSRLTIGALEAGASVEGPLSKNKNTTFLASYRRSYQQLLFRLFELPFLPTFNDFQFKIKNRKGDKHEFTALGLGAYDKFVLNTDANETEDQQFLLGTLPYINQWQYTIGGRYRNFTKTGNHIVVVSRTQQNSLYEKHFNNDIENDNALIFSTAFDESENKLRYERNQRVKGFKINYGAGLEFAQFNQKLKTAVELNSGLFNEIDKTLNVFKTSVFAQGSKTVLNGRLALSFGIRTDQNNLNDHMANPLNQISPRLSASIALYDDLNLNMNVGRYFQLPTYTTLGALGENNEFVNTDRLKYIGNNQFVIGLDNTFKTNTKVSTEFFYKQYFNYPFLLNDSISLANLGADFGIVGDQPAVSTNEGRAYGLEFSVEQKLYKGLFGIFSYTLSWSAFEDMNGNLVASSWDRRHVMNLALGKKLKRNWDISSKIAFATGNPYTPFDINASMQRTYWDRNGEGILDYNQLNTVRAGNVFQWDIRIDKKYYFKKWALNVYLDIRNVLNNTTPLNPNLSVARNKQGAPVVDPDNENQYLPNLIPNEDGFVQPSIGVVIEL